MNLVNPFSECGGDSIKDLPLLRGRLADDAGIASVSPISLVPRDQVRNNQVALLNDAGGGRASDLGRSRAGNEVGEKRQSAAGSDLHALAHLREELDLSHAAPGELLRELLTQVAQAKRLAEECDLFVIFDQAKSFQGRSDVVERGLRAQTLEDSGGQILALNPDSTGGKLPEARQKFRAQILGRSQWFFDSVAFECRDLKPGNNTFGRFHIRQE